MGTTKNNESCTRITSNPDRWCRRCTRPDAPVRKPSIDASALRDSHRDYLKDDMYEPLSKKQRYSGTGVTAMEGVIEKQERELKSLGFSGGVSSPEVTFDDKKEQVVTTDYIDIGVWESGTTIQMKEYLATTSYNPILAGEPLNFAVVAAYSSKEEGFVVPAQIETKEIPVKFNETCDECKRNVSQEPHLILSDGDNFRTICQKCYVKATKTKNKDVIEEAHDIISEMNLAFDNEIIPFNVFDGTIIRALSYAAVKNASAEGNGALEYFRDYVNMREGKVAAVTQRDIAEAANIDYYAFLSQHSNFLKPNEREIFERLMSPGYREADFPEIVKAVSNINDFDREAIDRAFVDIGGKAGVLPMGRVGVPLELRIQEIREFGSSYQLKEVKAVGIDGRKYTLTLPESVPGYTFTEEGGVINVGGTTEVTSLIEDGESPIPFHELRNFENSTEIKPAGECGKSKFHAFHSTVAPFAIFSQAITQGKPLKMCVDCKLIERE